MPGSVCPNLLSPLQIRGARLKNRIMSSGHDTTLPTDGTVNDALVAYQAARARGGTGLIVLQVSGVHETARYTNHILMATDDACIPGYVKVAAAVHAQGGVLFAQLFHPGREIAETDGGLLAVAYAPSAVPNERFHVMPRAMSRGMIAGIVTGYGEAARRMRYAGIDGVEIVASHGYLPSQFINPRVNLRDDEYGGSPDGRLRFLREVIADIRKKTDPDFVVGLRISGDEKDEQGLTEGDALAAVVALQSDLDYVHVTAGTSASLGGAVHIAPPMAFRSGYLAPSAAAVKARVQIPVFVTGRINQPQDAEAIIAAGQADVCGMTRALISDPDMPRKTAEGRLEDIRACIACNQACIGHFHKGVPISCIQHPASGRELRYDALPRAERAKRVLVAGGGPAGMKAAAIASERGHHVVLHEAGPRLGGQALIAQLLPDRSEFGGLITNLERELQLAQVPIRRNSRVDRALIASEAPDAVVVATGALPYTPAIEIAGELPVVQAWDVLTGKAQASGSIVVVDWRADWIGTGLAIHLARSGNRVRLAVNATVAGEATPFYVRDQANGQMHSLGVEVIPYARLFGIGDATVYLQHIVTGAPMILEEVDALVLCAGHAAVDTLLGQLDGFPGEVHAIGDCISPRTAEEAIFDGFRLGAAI